MAQLTNYQLDETRSSFSGLRSSSPLSNVSTTIIIPAYNEEAALPLVLKPLFDIIDDTYEVLIVDDGSSDNSASVARTFPCRVVQHIHNMGKGAAIRTGMLNAKGEKVIFIDADNTYPVEMIPNMVHVLDDYDMVRGLRSVGRENIPVLNRLGNRLFDTFIRVFHAVEGGDLLSGMYGGYRDKLLELDLESDGFAIEAEICVKSRAHGMACTTMPITYIERVGETKLRPLHDGVRILYRVLQLAFTHNPLLMFVWPGLVLATMGLVGLIWTIVKHFAGAEGIMQTYGMFALSVILLGGIQLIIFGLAVYEAGMAYGLRGRAHPVLDSLSQSLRRHNVMVAGLVLIVVGSMGFVWEIGNLLLSIPLPLNNPIMLTLISLSLLTGIQLLSSFAFLSALRGVRVNAARGIRE